MASQSLGTAYYGQLEASVTKISGVYYDGIVEGTPPQSAGVQYDIILEATPKLSTSTIYDEVLLQATKKRLKQLDLIEAQESFTIMSPIPMTVPSNYNLSFTPKYNASVRFYRQGLLQRQGPGLDYTVSGNTITYNGTATLATGHYLIAHYIRES